MEASRSSKLCDDICTIKILHQDKTGAVGFHLSTKSDK